MQKLTRRNLLQKISAVKSHIYSGGKESTLNTRIIDTADAVVRRYKTRNPEDIISQRAIKLKDIRFCHDLLGYYTVLLNCEYIGINPNCTAAQRISALAHELGHALFD